MPVLRARDMCIINTCLFFHRYQCELAICHLTIFRETGEIFFTFRYCGMYSDALCRVLAVDDQHLQIGMASNIQGR